MSCEEIERWFQTKFDPSMSVSPVGRGAAGDVEHLNLGVTAICAWCFMKFINAHWRSGDAERSGEEVAEWYKAEFPDHLSPELDEYYTGYEVCELIQVWLQAHSWEAFSVAEVLLAMGCPWVTRAQAFLSHAQAELWEHTGSTMVTASSVLGDKNTSFFVDYLCVRLCLEGDFKPLVVGKVVRTINHTVLLLGPPKKPWALSRAWCIFEAVKTASSKAPLTVIPLLSWDEVAYNPFASWRSTRFLLDRMQVKIKLEDCCSKDPEDKEQMKDELHSLMGRQATDRAASEAIKHGIEAYVKWGDREFAQSEEFTELLRY